MFTKTLFITLLILFASSVFSQTVFIQEFRSGKIQLTEQMKKDLSVVKDWQSDTVYVTPTYSKGFKGDHKVVVNPLYGAARGKNVELELKKYNKVLVLQREELYKKRGFWIQSGMLTVTKPVVEYVTRSEFDTSLTNQQQVFGKQLTDQQQAFRDSLRERDTRDSLNSANTIHFNGLVGTSFLYIPDNQKNSNYGLLGGGVFTYKNVRVLTTITVGGYAQNNKGLQGGIMFKISPEYSLSKDLALHSEVNLILHKDYSGTQSTLRQFGVHFGVNWLQFDPFEIIPTFGGEWGLVTQTEVKEYNLNTFRFATGLTVGVRF